MKFEKDRLSKEGKHDLARKIKHVSKNNDGLGYDIQSFTVRGDEIFIEVKTSKLSFSKSRYFISRNEVEIGKKSDNYWLYIVSDLKENNTKLLRLENPFNSLDIKVKLEPVQYLMLCEPA